MLLCLGVLIAVPCMALTKSDKSVAENGNKPLLTVWQIDSFEGGRGSRADYLNSLGKQFSQKYNYYVTVTSLSADAVRYNLENGIMPDAISYGAGAYGLEAYVNSYKCWCYGGYCLLTLNGDFSDVSVGNTVINEGKDNLASACALLTGLSGAGIEKPTLAYVNLINGTYKYLLGTQRDIFRLKTRQVQFKVKPITEFNDLYQNISVISSGERGKCVNDFIDFVIGQSDNVSKIGLFADGVKYDDEMRAMQNLSYANKITSPISKSAYDNLLNVIKSNDINKLKSLLN